MTRCQYGEPLSCPNKGKWHYIQREILANGVFQRKQVIIRRHKRGYCFWCKDFEEMGFGGQLPVFCDDHIFTLKLSDGK